MTKEWALLADTMTEMDVHEGTAYYTKSESSFGGIVGFITPYSCGHKDQSVIGGLKITNCYNTGSFQYTSNATAKVATYWGGILGGVNSLTVVPKTESEPYPYLMENCYNLFAETTAVSLKGFESPFRVGGLLGSAWCSGNAKVDTLYIKDSASVKVDARHYAGTNEYRHQTNKSSAGLYPVEPVKVGEVSTVTTKTADELKALTAPIDRAIDMAQAKGRKTSVCLGVQQALVAEEDGTKNIRLVAGLDTLNAEEFGFEAVRVIDNGEEKTATVSGGTFVYKAIKAVENGQEVEVKAADMGTAYFACLVISGTPVTGTVTYTVRSFVVRDGAKVWGTAMQFTVVDGVLSENVSSVIE